MKPTSPASSTASRKRSSSFLDPDEKKKLRALKNRQSAQKSRDQAKAYVSLLEDSNKEMSGRISKLEQQNQLLTAKLEQVMQLLGPNLALTHTALPSLPLQTAPNMPPLFNNTMQAPPVAQNPPRKQDSLDRLFDALSPSVSTSASTSDLSFLDHVPSPSTVVPTEEQQLSFDSLFSLPQSDGSLYDTPPQPFVSATLSAASPASSF
ncbi:hypothetical protein HDU91_002974, partial [Kappamyces sp. JEL0680]